MKKTSKIRKTIVVILAFTIISTFTALTAAAYSYTTATSKASSTAYDCPNSGSM